MTCSQSSPKELIRGIMQEAGAYRCGFADAGAVDAEAVERYEQWIAEGRHGTMSYLERYGDVRRDPRLLLDGARTVIVCAFNYLPRAVATPGCARFARYAYGEDYHEAIRHRLERAAGHIREQLGGNTRVCIDTAPLRERYWAQRAGVGFVGVNQQLIVPGGGTWFFIGTVLWTGEVDADEPCTLTCEGCGRCAKACPGGALDGHGGMDARRCLSYLTIEYRGALPDEIEPAELVYGCDVCQEVCPHNAQAPVSGLPEFAEAVPPSLTTEEIAAMTPEEFAARFRHSAVKRTKLAGLQRNAAWVEKSRSDDIS